MLAVIAYTCARSQDVIGLELDDLASDLSWLRLPNRSGTKFKTPLAQPASDHLDRYLRATSFARVFSPGPVFRCIASRSERLLEKGMSRDALRAMVRRRAESAGMPCRITPRLVRSTSIATLLERGAELETAQSFVRHVCVETTRLYAPRDRAFERRRLGDLLPFEERARW